MTSAPTASHPQPTTTTTITPTQRTTTTRDPLRNTNPDNTFQRSISLLEESAEVVIPARFDWYSQGPEIPQLQQYLEAQNNPNNCQTISENLAHWLIPLCCRFWSSSGAS